MQFYLIAKWFAKYTLITGEPANISTNTDLVQYSRISQVNRIWRFEWIGEGRYDFIFIDIPLPLLKKFPVERVS